jgi:hypothetical protein
VFEGVTPAVLLEDLVSPEHDEEGVQRALAELFQGVDASVD